MSGPAPAAPDWDALAPHWHLFETAGTNRAITSTLLAHLAPPVLYVGGGRGTYAAMLRDRLGEIIVVDASLPMTRRARRDFALSCIQADVRRLPLVDGGFASACCATGVIEYLGADDRVDALAELGRVVEPGGPILITAFAGPGVGPPDGRSVALEAWYHGDGAGRPRPSMSFAFDGVARELGDRLAAYRLLRASLPRADATVGGHDVATAAGAAHLAVVAMAGRPDRGVATWHLVHSPAGLP